MRILCALILLTATAFAQTVNGVPNQTVNGYGGVNTFGDSITDGIGSTTVRQGGSGSKGYAWQLINIYGAGTNYGYGGDQAGDTAVKINNITPQVSNNFLTTIMVSTNDQSVYGSNSGLQTVFQNALSYSAAYAAIPDTAKLHFANGATQNGNCTFTSSNANAWALEQRSGFVISSMQTPPPVGGGNSDGSHVSCTFTLYKSGPIYLAYLIYNGWFSGSTLSVQVDGGSATVFNTNPTGSTSITTANGQAFFPILGRIPGPFTAGNHTVLITLGGGNTADAGELFWLGGLWPASSNVTSGNNSAPPAVFVGGTPWQQNDTGEPLSGVYNGLIQSAIATLTSDGLPVQFVNIRNYLNSSTDFNGGTLANGIICPVSALNPLHPGDCGHAHLAQAFLSSMPTSNFSGPLPGLLTYYGPVRSTTGGGGWVFGNPSAWQVGTSIGLNGTAAGCTVVGGIVTGTCSGAGATTNITPSVTVSGCTVSGTVCTVGTATSTVTFSVIPGTYNHLKLYVNGRCSAAANNAQLYMQFNGDTGTNYSSSFLSNSNAGISSTPNTASATPVMTIISCGNAPANDPGEAEFQIPFYSGTTFLKKGTVDSIGAADTTISNAFLQTLRTAWFWNSTAAINSITIGVVGGSNLIAGSTLTLYGVN